MHKKINYGRTLSTCEKKKAEQKHSTRRERDKEDRKESDTRIDTVGVCTQSVFATPQSELVRVQEQYKKDKNVSVHEILASNALKTEGILVAYVAKVISDDKTQQIVLSDDKSEIFCSVHPYTAHKHKIEKDAVLVILSASVWRLPYVKYTPALNITEKNIVEVVRGCRAQQQ